MPEVIIMGVFSSSSMHNLPIGPYHPALKEPESFILQVEGEKVISCKYEMGYNHRGIEKFAVGKDVTDVLFLAERVCGICSQAHTSCYCYDTEKIFGVDLPKRADYIRTAMMELSRIHNHLFALGLIAYQLGFKSMFMWCWDLREAPLSLIEKVCGNRYQSAINLIGGVRYDITPDAKKVINSKLSKMLRDLEKVEKFFDTPPVHSRLDNLGILSKKRALELGVLGPVARASGIKIDERTNYGPYKELGYKMITAKKGDSWTRNLMRLNEIKESARLIQEMKLPQGKLKSPYTPKAGKERFDVEAPRGRNYHELETDGKKILSLSIMPPTVYNLKALDDMMKGAHVADAPVVLMSLDPCFACNDRALVIDGNKRKHVKFDAGKVISLG